MRILLISTLVLVAAFAACGGDDGPDHDTSKAIMYTTTYIHDTDTPGLEEPRGTATPHDGKHDCLIPAGASDYLEGTCEWDVASTDDGGWLVKYLETWKCADYNSRVGNTTFCPEETGTHQWIYQVDPVGNTRFLSDGGEPAPEGLGAGAPVH